MLRNQATVVVDTRGVNDTNGGELVVTNAGGTTHGTVVISADKKTITYTPSRDYTGNDRLTYSVNDGTSSGTATADLALCVQ